MLVQLFYISRASKDLTATDHKQILSKARLNNRALGITGLLVVKGDYFAQALEGEEEKVIALYEKIKLDKRHTSVVRLSMQKVEHRVFPGWDMGFKDINKLKGPLSEIDLQDPRYVSDPSSLSMVFSKFVNEQPVH